MTASLVQRMRVDKLRTFFAFLSYNDPEHSTCLKVLHSLIFQVLFDEPELRPVVLEAYDLSYRQLNSDVTYVVKLLKSLLHNSSPVYLVIDGLDEADEHQRQDLLKSILSIQEDCGHVRFFLSCRIETDIAQILSNGFIPIKVDENNAEDITVYVRNEFKRLIDQMRRFGAGEDTCSTIGSQSTRVTEKAKGAQ